MALHTKKVDGDGSHGQQLAVDPLLAGEVESVPKHRMPDGPMTWPTRSSTTSSCSTATPA